MKISPLRKGSFLPLAITLCSIAVVSLLYVTDPNFLEFLELKTYDLRLQSRGTLLPSENIVLAVIDEKSLREEGRWPWPRWKIAKLVDKLSENGAKVIAFDIGFFEPDQYMDTAFIDNLEVRLREGNVTKV